MRKSLGTGLAAALAAATTACAPKPTGPACEEARYEGRVVDSVGVDFGPVALIVDDHGRSSGLIDGIQDGAYHFLGEVTWTELEVYSEGGHFDTINALAPDCGSEDAKVRAHFTAEDSWDGWLQVWCGRAGKSGGAGVTLTFEAFKVE